MFNGVGVDMKRLGLYIFFSLDGIRGWLGGVSLKLSVWIKIVEILVLFESLVVGIWCYEACLLNFYGVFKSEESIKEEGHLACFYNRGRLSKGIRPLRESLLIGGPC